MITRRPSKLRTALSMALIAALGSYLLAPLRPAGAIPNALPNRSIKISDSKPSAINVRYLITFDILTPGTLGSIRFQFCQEDPIPDEPCTPPSGFSDSSAVLSSQSGVGDFTIDPSSTPNAIIITHTPAAVGTITLSFTFDGIVNPSAIGSYYARIQTYASNNASGPATDKGGIAMIVTPSFDVTAEVPPILIFCAGAVIASEDCSDIRGDTIDIGILGTNRTASGTSQLVVGTNATGGYTISVAGTTLTAGNEIIPPLTNQTASQRGAGQFGINLRKNTNPTTGEEPGGPGSGQPVAVYDSPNLYRFRSGDSLATKASTEDFRKYTVSYVANVSPAQGPGVYATTLSYICLANF